MSYKFNPFTGELDYYESGGGGGGAVDSVNGETGDVVLTQDNIGDGTTYKQYSATEKTKLAGIASGATANSSDATLLNRANHTGTQLASTVSNFAAAVSANTDVAANTAARHSALTISTNTASALSLAGQALSIADVFVQNAGDTMTGQLIISAGGLTVDGATVFNNTEAATSDFQIKGDTDTNLFFVDVSTNRIGFGTATPAEKLQVIGNFQVDDSATSTKGYRFRTSGSNLDLDAAGTDLFLSVYSGAGFTGTQRQYIAFGAEFEFEKHLKKVIFNNNSFQDGMVWDPASGLVVNEQGNSFDTRIEGDTDQNLLFVDASADFVGIGTNAPNNKLDVAGTVQMDGLRIDQAPTAATPTPTHTFTISLNGTTYRVPCVV